MGYLVLGSIQCWEIEIGSLAGVRSSAPLRLLSLWLFGACTYFMKVTVRNYRTFSYSGGIAASLVFINEAGDVLRAWEYAALVI